MLWTCLYMIGILDTIMYRIGVHVFNVALTFLETFVGTSVEYPTPFTIAPWQNKSGMLNQNSLWLNYFLTFDELWGYSVNGVVFREILQLTVFKSRTWKSAIEFITIHVCPNFWPVMIYRKFGVRTCTCMYVYLYTGLNLCILQFCYLIHLEKFRFFPQNPYKNKQTKNLHIYI